jgi:hypothetical protein
MKKYKIVIFSRQDFMCRDVVVEAESAEKALERDWLNEIARDAWDDWGKEECEDFAECLEQVIESELFPVCAVEDTADFTWGSFTEAK